MFLFFETSLSLLKLGGLQEFIFLSEVFEEM